MANERLCEIPSCSKPIYARGFCWGHYRKLLRYGNPLWQKPKVTRQNCSLEGCNNIARGSVNRLCSKHYQRLRKYGDPKKGGTEIGAPLAFFKNVVLHHTGQDCLIWPYSTNGANGYGQLRIEGKLHLVHRLACIARHGPPNPSNLHAAHTCGCGHLGCCSPAHVEWKTAAENTADMITHGTALRGEALHSTKLTEEDVHVIRSLLGSMTQKQIGDLFGVCNSTICSIKNGRRWSWLAQADS